MDLSELFSLTAALDFSLVTFLLENVASLDPLSVLQFCYTRCLLGTLFSGLELLPA